MLEKASTRTRVSFEVGVRAARGAPGRARACRAASSGGESPSATRRACSRATATPSSSARRPPRACARWRRRRSRSSTRSPTTATPCRCCATSSRSRSRSARTHRRQARRASSATASSNMARSWLEAARDLRLPPGRSPVPAATCRRAAELDARRRARHARDHDPQRRGRPAATSSTPTSGRAWGRRPRRERGHRVFAGWTVTDDDVGRGGGAIVLHCLPAHRGEEIDEATLEGPVARLGPGREPAARAEGAAAPLARTGRRNRVGEACSTTVRYRPRGSQLVPSAWHAAGFARGFGYPRLRDPVRRRSPPNA